MRPLLALLSSALLALAGSACGSTGTLTGSMSATSPAAGAVNSAAATGPARAARPGGYLKRDGDRDFDDVESAHKTGENDNGPLFVSYGPRARTSDARAVTALVKRYYAAAAAGDGATACSLLAAGLITGVAAGQGQSGQGARGACVASMSLTFRQQHQRLAAEDVATMLVTSVHVKGNLGLALLGFRTMPEGEIVVEREGHTWKIDALLGSDLT
jgi:hypothetical protein